MSFWTNPFNLVAPEFHSVTKNWLGDSGATDAERSQAGMDNQEANQALPPYPSYISGYNPNTQSVSNINPNTQGLDAYRSEALRQGPSTWAQLASGRSYAEEAAARDALSKESASGTATARSAVASHGGFTSGAGERANTAGALGYMQGSTNLANQGGLNRQQIGINDEQNRITQLGALPGMENQLAQIKTGQKEFDVSQATAEAARQNQFNMGNYQNQASAISAGKQAQAIQKSGGGTWVCSESIRKGDKDKVYSERESSALEHFKKYALKFHPKVTRFYLYRCGKLVEKMNKEGANWEVSLKFIRRVIKMVELEEMEQAFDEYSTFIINLIQVYWPDCDNPIYLANREEMAS